MSTQTTKDKYLAKIRSCSSMIDIDAVEDEILDDNDAYHIRDLYVAMDEQERILLNKEQAKN